jgi:very-short-patch-repair endonuclease
MEGKSDERDAAMAVLAARQHGVVAYRQLVRLDFTPGAIEHRLRNRRLHPLYRGVYAVGHANATQEGRYMAAVLTCGEDAALSHWSGTAHWELLGVRHGAAIHVSVVGNRRRQPGLRVHRLTSECERTLRDGIPVTTVARTLLDIAPLASPKQLRRATNEAERRGLLEPWEVNRLIDRHKGRRGMKAFAAVTAAVSAGTRRTRSDLEDDFLAFCRRHRIDTPVVNGTVAGYEVDMHWPGTTLVVELDGYEYHRTPTSFEQDRRKDADLKLQGYTVIRVTGAWMDADAAGLAATIRQLLRTT